MTIVWIIFALFYAGSIAASMLLSNYVLREWGRAYRSHPHKVSQFVRMHPLYRGYWNHADCEPTIGDRRNAWMLDLVPIWNISIAMLCIIAAVGINARAAYITKRFGSERDYRRWLETPIR
jgi:hypothetical protein